MCRYVRNYEINNRKKIKSMKDNEYSELELKGDTLTIQVHNKFQSIPVKGDKNQFHLEPYLDP